MYLFDTDALSNIVKPRPSRRLISHLEHLPAALQFTTAITVGEIYFGAARSARKHEILKAFEEAVFPRVTVLPFDAESGRTFGLLKAELERAGTGCSEPDLRIAAIAIQHRLNIVTGNVKHFERIPGLTIENWLD